MAYRRMLYIFAIIKRNDFKVYMFGVVGETHAHDYFEQCACNCYSNASIYIDGGAKIWILSSRNENKILRMSVAANE